MYPLKEEATSQMMPRDHYLGVIMTGPVVKARRDEVVPNIQGRHDAPLSSYRYVYPLSVKGGSDVPSDAPRQLRWTHDPDFQ